MANLSLVGADNGKAERVPQLYHNWYQAAGRFMGLTMMIAAKDGAEWRARQAVRETAGYAGMRSTKMPSKPMATSSTPAARVSQV